MFSGTNRRRSIPALEIDKDDLGKKDGVQEMEKVTSEADGKMLCDNGLKLEECTQEEGEFFNQEYYNDDDDFEWKEEPLVEIHDESPDSEGELTVIP